MKKYVSVALIALFVFLVPMLVLAAELKISWTDMSNNETHFEVERSAASAGPFVKIASPAANAVLYTDENLAENTTFFYKLRACNTTAACSAYTAVASGKTVISIPATPTGLTVTPIQ